MWKLFVYFEHFHDIQTHPINRSQVVVVVDLKSALSIANPKPRIYNLKYNFKYFYIMVFNCVYKVNAFILFLIFYKNIGEYFIFVRNNKSPSWFYSKNSIQVNPAMFRIEGEEEKKTIINLDRLLSPTEVKVSARGTPHCGVTTNYWPPHSCSENCLRIKTTLDDPCESWH